MSEKRHGLPVTYLTALGLTFAAASCGLVAGCGPSQTPEEIEKARQAWMAQVPRPSEDMEPPQAGSEIYFVSPNHYMSRSSLMTVGFKTRNADDGQVEVKAKGVGKSSDLKKVKKESETEARYKVVVEGLPNTSQTFQITAKNCETDPYTGESFCPESKTDFIVTVDHEPTKVSSAIEIINGVIRITYTFRDLSGVGEVTAYGKTTTDPGSTYVLEYTPKKVGEQQVVLDNVKDHVGNDTGRIVTKVDYEPFENLDLQAEWDEENGVIRVFGNSNSNLDLDKLEVAGQQQTWLWPDWVATQKVEGGKVQPAGDKFVDDVPLPKPTGKVTLNVVVRDRTGRAYTQKIVVQTNDLTAKEKEPAFRIAGSLAGLGAGILMVTSGREIIARRKRKIARERAECEEEARLLYNREVNLQRQTIGIPGMEIRLAQVSQDTGLSGLGQLIDSIYEVRSNGAIYKPLYPENKAVVEKLSAQAQGIVRNAVVALTDIKNRQNIGPRQPFLNYVTDNHNRVFDRLSEDMRARLNELDIVSQAEAGVLIARNVRILSGNLKKTPGVVVADYQKKVCEHAVRTLLEWGEFSQANSFAQAVGNNDILRQQLISEVDTDVEAVKKGIDAALIVGSPYIWRETGYPLDPDKIDGLFTRLDFPEAIGTDIIDKTRQITEIQSRVNDAQGYFEKWSLTAIGILKPLSRVKVAKSVVAHDQQAIGEIRKKLGFLRKTMEALDSGVVDPQIEGDPDFIQIRDARNDEIKARIFKACVGKEPMVWRGQKIDYKDIDEFLATVRSMPAELRETILSDAQELADNIEKLNEYSGFFHMSSTAMELISRLTADSIIQIFNSGDRHKRHLISELLFFLGQAKKLLSGGEVGIFTEEQEDRFGQIKAELVGRNTQLPGRVQIRAQSI